ncbi:MAG: adenylate cyclase 1 [Bacilli bacterium]|nr:adenylate cyclase 1 [Bacilli bacterium]
MKRKLWTTAIIGNIPVLLLCILLISPLLVLSNALYDQDMKSSMTNDYKHNIVIVAIDDESLHQIGTFPWKRTTYIPVIDKLEKMGVKSIGFDVMFNEASNEADDNALAAEFAKYKNIILPAQAEFSGKFNEIDNSASSIKHPNEAVKSKDVLLPLPIFANVTQVAQVNAILDKDNVIRKTFLQINTGKGIYDSLAVKSAANFGVDVNKFLNKYPSKDMQIKFDLNSSDIQLIPFTKLMNDTGKIHLKNTVVLIGFTANGISDDDGRTPIEKKTKLVYVHANIINQLINDTHLSPENKGLTYLLIFLLFALGIFFSWKFKPTTSFIIVFAIIIVLLFGQYAMFAYQDVFINTVNPISALLLSFLVNISIKTYFETKQKNYITKQFGRYISPDLVKEIAKSDKEIQLGGISKELSVLFLDVRGFTPLSEKLQPEEVVGFLNMMFNLITEKALENQGTIDKFIGDAAMILYNAPLDVVHHEYYAVKSAFEIQKGMVQVREDVLAKYGVTISVGIGINTGLVVVGNIGSYLRVDYTAIGDNVNTAARIESNTQPNQVLVSEATYERTNQYFEYNCVGEKMMKGKSVPVKLYEVIDHIKAPE